MVLSKTGFAKVEEQLKWSVLCALVLAFFTAFKDVGLMERSPGLEIWLWSAAAQLTLFLYWALATPAVLYVMEWLRRTRRTRSHAIAIHAGLFLLLGTLFYGFLGLVNTTIWPMPGQTATWKTLLQFRVFAFLFMHSAIKYYLPVYLAGALYAYYLRTREEELKASELKRQLSEAQFRLLKMQLHPHFLFNALNSISTLTYTDPAKADRMIALLSDLLRVSLEATDVVTVPLEEELQYATKYLEIERVRFSDRLETKFCIEEGALSSDVPNLILQPLVENAVKHGISKLPGHGKIEVKAWRERGGLVIRVDDNGPGLVARATEGGVGTRYIRERLERLYGCRARFEMKNLLPRGTRQELFIPLDDVCALYETAWVESGAAP